MQAMVERETNQNRVVDLVAMFNNAMLHPVV
jgi:hypothetical protein